MTSIDELFKKDFTSSGNKRKHEPAKDPDEIYKAAKLREGSSPDRPSLAHRGVAADQDDDAADIEAGPELPDDFNPEDEVAGPEDDDEGRFFGGGVSKDTIRALELVDKLEEQVPAPEQINSAWLKKTFTRLEKRINKNAELRARFQDQPQKFLASEADLDADVRSLSLLSENTHLYGEFADIGCAAALVSLLAHENTDIAIQAVEVIAGLTDEDTECDQPDWDKLVNAMLDADLVELLGSNFARLDESSEYDRAGVYHILSVIENLCSQAPISQRICKDRSILTWLLKRIGQKDSGLLFSQNRQYAAEILSILTQVSRANSETLLKHDEPDAMDTLLEQLSVYRRRDPEKKSEEEEFVENMFDCLTCLVDVAAGKEKFVQAEGVELCQIMISEGKLSKWRAIKVLSHACSGRGAAVVCEKLVTVALLKPLFKMFAKKQEEETTEHLLSIFNSLLTYLPGDSPCRIRTLAKFMEKNYEKTERLIQLRREYATRLKAVEDNIARERRRLNRDDIEEREAAWLLERLDGGLFSLQIIDVILAWLVAEDEAATTKIKEVLADRDERLDAVKKTLLEQVDDLDDSEEGSLERKEMLSTLLRFLD